MKKQYTTCKMRIYRMQNRDIVTVSGDVNKNASFIHGDASERDFEDEEDF